MKVGFNFANLLGTVYHRGNLVFTPDGNSLLSPVGNRITCFNLVDNKSFTFAFEHRKNIARVALSPQGTLLLSIDEDGRAILTNFPRRTVLHHFTFKSAVTALSFSPDGTHFAIALGRKIEVWRTPPSYAESEREFAPFVKHREYTGHYDAATHITWSGDSRFFLTAAKDLTARLWSLNPTEGFVPTVLSSHREAVVGAWFSKDQETIYTCSRDGALVEWKYTTRPRKEGEDEPMEDEDEDERWYAVNRNYFMQNAKVKCAAFHKESGLLVVGFSSGIFGLYELPDFNAIHTLSISQTGIDFVTINPSGDWLAFGASKLGQLLVWEWQSESYVLKQQGHFDALNALSYSPDGQRLITSADDGKLKVWDAASGFCIVTFTEHTAAVTAIQFAKRGNVLFSASLDGSVRAWDLVRYRNFRTFTAARRVQFSCLAVDPSGEVVCAAGVDSFDIHVWSVQTGQLLEQLPGHEGPVSSLAFAPNGANLVSGSWDRTVRIWSIFSRTQTSEPLQQQSDVLAVAYRPDSRQIVVSTLDGQLSFWDAETAEPVGAVDGRRDVSGGRKATDRVTAANSAATKHFSAVAYSADGTCVLAGGTSKYICLYDVASGSLVKKFTVSQNLALDGTQEFLNSRNLTEAGPADLLDAQGEASDLEDRIDRTLPGASRGDLSRRAVRPEIRVAAVAFSPTGREFAAACTEGLVLYSLDNVVVFDPFDLDVDVTPAAAVAALEKDADYLKALVMAFRLNEKWLIQRVYEGTPVDDVPLVVKDLPVVYLGRLLRCVAGFTEEGPHLEFGLVWIDALLTRHGRTLRERRGEYDSEMRLITKCVQRIQAELVRLADDNTYTLEYLLSKPAKSAPSQEAPAAGTKAIAANGHQDEEHSGSDEEMDGVDEEWHGVSSDSE